MQKFPSSVLSSIRVHLEEEKKRLTERINELRAQDPFSDPAHTDTAASDTEANNEESHDRFTALVGELTRQLAETDAALRLIGDGSYGFCTTCGNMIDTDRLAVVPAATLCIACEKKKKR